MTVVNPDRDALKAILQKAKRIAVVGLSDNPERTSYQIASFLLEKGYEVIPVNPAIETALGIQSVPNLTAIKGHVDLVNVFRRTEFLYEVAEETVKIGADVFWAQLGLVDEAAYDLLKENGITPVMDRCIKVQHDQLLGG
ncbi:MAG TPA: CoA-binding protein [Sporolactobacillaceae bacterium]|nr:CoA-binding protein [Sporolactobacillaceae bacterium]